MKVDGIYRHADGGFYRCLDIDVKIKCWVTGEWHDAVLYEYEREGLQRYVRTQADFAKRFTLVDRCICCRGVGEMKPASVLPTGEIRSACDNCGAFRVGHVWTWSQAQYDDLKKSSPDEVPK